MENKQFTSDDLPNNSPHSHQGFQAARFVKTTTHLSIPDTIPENCSGEFSGENLKMEASKVITQIFNDEDKENIDANYPNKCNESLDTSSVIAIDNSYIRQCERKLLESSNSDSERSIKNNSEVERHILNVPRMSSYPNDSISTPPSALRKEISLLRSEMAEVHEFHDFEIQLLKEEKFENEADSYNYSEIISKMTEKYSALMELYTNLKTEYDDYRNEQEQMRQEIQSKTADCLESLCSQIEASDSSLNFSSTSFVSFTGGIRSSTMMEDISEVEATVLHDATVLANDPLSITNDGTFKTPLQTPLKSAKKFFPQELNSTTGKPIVKEVNEIIAKRDTTIPLDSEYSMQLLNVETALYDKIKEVEDLEQRLFKVEDVSSMLQSELERITSQNNTLKENLSKKTEQLNELTQKLFTEIISLNPSLRDSLVDIPGTKLLIIFIEVIMESCKKIQTEEITKHVIERAEWESRSKADATAIENLQNQLSSQGVELEELKNCCRDLERKLSDAENTILTRDEEILMLQSHVSNVRQTREEFASAREALSELESKLTLTEAEKRAVENRYRELEAVVEGLKREIESNENVQTKLEEEKSLMKTQFESEVAKIKENLTSAEEMLQTLNSQLQLVELEKANLENRCSEIENRNQNLQSEVEAAKNIQTENDSLKQRILEFEETSVELKTDLEAVKEDRDKNITKVEDLLKEIENLKKHNSETFGEVEEIQRNLLNLPLGSVNNSDSPSERIAKLVENTTKSHETKIIPIFVQTIAKACERVQNELLEKFDSKKLEWETQKDVEIRKLQDEINSLVDGSNQTGRKILELNTEKEDLLKLQESLKNRMAEAEKIISDCREEIKTRETALKQTECELAAAGERIVELKSQLSSARTEKEETEIRCRKFEEGTQDEIQTVLKELDEFKILLEEAYKEKQHLKGEISKLEEDKMRLEESLEKTTEEQSGNETKMRDLQQEMTLLRQRQEDLTSLSEKLEKNNRNLMEVLTDLQSSLDIPKDTLTELQMGGFENKKIFTDRINNLIKNQMEALKLQNEISLEERKQAEDLRNKCEVELTEVKNSVTVREEEIQALRLQIQKTKDELESQISDMESEKKQNEIRCRELEEIVEKLKQELVENEKQRTELQLLVEERKVENVRLEEELKAKHDEEIQKTNETNLELCRNLEAKLGETEAIIASREEEIQILQRDIKQIKEQHEETKQQLEANETHRRELEQIIENLKIELETKEILRMELATQKSEIIHLKESYEILKAQMTEAENVITTREEEIRVLKTYQTELTTIKENLVTADETILMLKSQMKSIEVEKSQMENRCTELQISNKNLENYEKIQTENDDLKQRIFDSERMMTELKNELEMAREDQMNNICKVEELIREVEELKKENNGFSHALFTIEETQRNLADLLSDDANDNDLPGDRITKIIAKTTKPADTKETKIVSDFVETITKTCKGVQNELIKKFDSKKLEWETQRDFDLQNLHDEIKILTETNTRQEVVLSQTKNELTLADETILRLKSQLSLAQIEKAEAEIKCRKLEENLQSEMDTKETIIKGLDELKILREKVESENFRLRQQMQESEDVLVCLKNHLKTAEEEQNVKERKIQDLLKEMDLLKKEKEGLNFVTEKLEKIEKSNKNLLEVLADVQTHLDMPDDILTKFLSGDYENKKVFSQRINEFTKTQMEGLKAENKNLKLGNENLKQEIKQLTKLMGETASSEMRDQLSNLNASHSNSICLRSKSNKNIDLCVRRLDKLEEINHNLTELLTRILTMTEFPELEKLKLCSVREYPSVTKKVVAHVNDILEKIKEMKEENGQLDEECETYANIIKDLKKEAAAVWKDNKEKTEAMEVEIERLKEEKRCLEKEREELTNKISKLSDECMKLKSKSEGTLHNCTCGNESKKINELKRAILVKEQKLLELQDLEAQTSSYKSQIEYLKTALEREKKKIGEEKEKNIKLQIELNEATKNQKAENKKPDENQVLDELRMRGSISGGIVQEFVDKEKMRKLSKDIGILKELCRARYAEIKRLEAVNAALRNGTPKNSNQMDSPIHSRGYNTRSKNQIRDFWKTEIGGKENNGL